MGWPPSKKNIHRLNYIDITKHTSIQSSRVMEIMARYVLNNENCYILSDYQLHYGGTVRLLWNNNFSTNIYI